MCESSSVCEQGRIYHLALLESDKGPAPQVENLFRRNTLFPSDKALFFTEIEETKKKSNFSQKLKKS